jgi:hypothetical protein
MMRANLHSIETYLYKYLLPLVFVPWDGFRDLRSAFPSNDPHFAGTIWILLGAWCVMAPLIFWYAFKLKTVVLDGSVLRIKSYITRIDVPIANVANLKWRNPLMMPHVTLRLKGDSEFGDKIVFIPRRRIATDAGYRSTLEVLQELINER